MSLSYILGDDKHTQNDNSIIDVLSNLLIGKKMTNFRVPCCGETLTKQTPNFSLKKKMWCLMLL